MPIQSTTVLAENRNDSVMPANAQPANLATDGNTKSKNWHAKALIPVWLIVVYAVCFLSAINTMVAFNAQKDVLVFSRAGGSTAANTDAPPAIAAKAQLAEAIELRQEISKLKQSAAKSADAKSGTAPTDGERLSKLEAKFAALPTYIRDAAIESESGVGREGIGYLMMPMMMITLLMSMWMGALGSAIHMTVEYLDPDSRKSGVWYFFRPFLGAVLALAVFIVFKAGQIVLTASPAGNNAELNPYIVAFVAIISGMLTDQAYRRIGIAGSQFLGPKADDRPRYLRSEVAKAKLQGRSTETLAQLVAPTDVATVQRWLDGTAELSAYEQVIVAAWLDASPRDLFTDQPPTAANLALARSTDGDGAVAENGGEEGVKGSKDAKSGGEGAAEPAELPRKVA